MENLFNKEKYIQRRAELKKKVANGIIILFGNQKAAMNYAGNTYPFRQDSNFLYFIGLDSPGLAAIMDCESGEEILFGPEFTVDDLIWDGRIEKLEDKAFKAGISKTMILEKLDDQLKIAVSTGRKIHYLPPYRGERTIRLSELLDIPISKIYEKASLELIKAIVSMRSFKDADEIKEIETALNTATTAIYARALKMKKPGIKEYEFVAMAEASALEHNSRLAFPVICSINGQYLHNESYDNTLESGKLLILDTGSESTMHYASDITRTYPVDKKFTNQQAEIYQLVLEMQQSAIDIMKPGLPYAVAHRKASETLANGMLSLGLMKGNAEEIVNEGAHALFFPHGLGHQMGLDVHDMEDLGENYTGYDDKYFRSTQFGTRFLRFGKELKPGLVLTVEPGIYFIPALIDLWRKEGKFEKFINYHKLDYYLQFGGIRIEDDVLITETGNRILGNPIPKTINEIENLAS